MRESEGETYRGQEERDKESALASRDVPCVGVEEGGGGVGAGAGQNKMPGGWLNNTGFDE